MPSHITRRELYEWIGADDPPVLVEALGAGYYGDAHLPGAVNIPPGQVDRIAQRLLPDRDASIVVYCTGACTSSGAVARRLEQLGYTRVGIYQGGKEDWVEHGLPLERLDAAGD